MNPKSQTPRITIQYMAGIYIHIPFCKTKCCYCDFYSKTDFSLWQDFEKALCIELKERAIYLDKEIIQTIYFGGGTPSLLPFDFYQRLFEVIYANYSVAASPEITFEANPDDLTVDYIRQLRSLPVNRISMGVQSFIDAELTCLNRRHSALDAEQAVKRCREMGFEHISIDLMYGLPGQTLADWQYSLTKAINLNVEHISAYHLIYEQGTPIYSLMENGSVIPVGEEISNAMFELLIDRLSAAGYEHYEISNFAKNGCLSKHNTSYWKGEKYLGAGPAAHSYNGISRCFNVSNTPLYIAGMIKNEPVITEECIDKNTSYNEKVITSLRTSEGMSLLKIEQEYGKEYLDYLLKQAKRYISSGLLIYSNDHILKLSRKGLFVSDGIMSDLLIVDAK